MLAGLETILVKVVNYVLAGLVAAINALIAAWPIGMPTLPTLPSGLLTAIGWVKWSPLPVTAGLAFLLFSITVYTVWLIAGAALRWGKFIP